MFKRKTATPDKPPKKSETPEEVMNRPNTVLETFKERQRAKSDEQGPNQLFKNAVGRVIKDIKMQKNQNLTLAEVVMLRREAARLGINVDPPAKSRRQSLQPKKEFPTQPESQEAKSAEEANPVDEGTKPIEEEANVTEPPTEHNKGTENKSKSLPSISSTTTSPSYSLPTLLVTPSEEDQQRHVTARSSSEDRDLRLPRLDEGSSTPATPRGKYSRKFSNIGSKIQSYHEAPVKSPARRAPSKPKLFLKPKDKAVMDVVPKKSLVPRCGLIGPKKILPPRTEADKKEEVNWAAKHEARMQKQRRKWERKREQYVENFIKSRDPEYFQHESSATDP